LKSKKYRKFLFLGTAWICCLNFSFGQGGGRSSFDFMNLPSSARLGAMGGYNVSLIERDVNLLFSSPGLISEKWHNHAAFNYLSYYAGVSLSSVAYARNMERHGVWAIGFQYLDLGQFQRRDDTGLDLGEFSANEYFLVVGRSHKSGNFQTGASFKYSNSTIDIYTAHALLFDIGGVFIHPEQEFTLGLAIKNFGFILSDYTEESEQRVPFDVQLGITIKPEYMPFRFSLTAHHLAYPNVLYDDETFEQGNNYDRPGVIDKVLSHINVGSEILISKNFNIRAGYNHLISKELGLMSGSKGSGFSYGFMLGVKAFEFSFGRATYHASGGMNFFSLQSNFDTLFTKDNN
jgi:hypothetical protein